MGMMLSEDECEEVPIASEFFIFFRVRMKRVANETDKY